MYEPLGITFNENCFYEDFLRLEYEYSVAITIKIQQDIYPNHNDGEMLITVRNKKTGRCESETVNVFDLNYHKERCEDAVQNIVDWVEAVAQVTIEEE